MINIEDLRIRDPFVLNENGTYYLYANGTDAQGNLTIVCYQTKDMKLLEKPISIMGSHPYSGYTDFWAPEVIKYRHRFYLVMTLSHPNGHRGSYIFVAASPLGPFSVHGEGLLTPKNMMCLDGHIYVEDNQPYLFFCHEWVECIDGTILVSKLSDDLTSLIETPKLLFKASDAPWTLPLAGQSYVTDGPFITKKDTQYQMLWSSFSKDGYALGLAYSNHIYGPWQHKQEPIYAADGGHGMVFSLNGNPTIVIHSPNSKQERATLLPYQLVVE